MVLIAAAHVQAQLVRPNARIIDTRAGLSHDQVNAMARDRRGHMWFGTSDGLSRFDGTHVKVYGTSSDHCRLPNDHINALATDSAGLLYIGSEGPMLTVLDPLMDTLVNIMVPGGTDADVTAVRISSIRVDLRGRIWVCHGHRILSLFDPTKRTFRSVTINTPNGHPQGRNWIRNIVEGRDGFLWLCCEFGIVRFDPRDFTYRAYPNRPGSPTSEQFHVTSVIDEGRTLLIATYDHGIFDLDTETGQWSRIGPFENLMVMDMLALGPDHIRLATIDRGLLDLDRRTRAIASYDRDLAHTRSRERNVFLPGAMCFFRDPEGTLWIGSTQTGVALIAPRNNRFNCYGLPVNGTLTEPSDVVGVAVHPSTKLWLVLTWKEGLFALDSTGSVAWHIPYPWTDLPLALFSDLLITPGGTIYVATSRELFTVDPARKRFVPAHSGTPFANHVQELWGDGGNGLWADIGGRGLMHMDTVSGAVRSIEQVAPGISDHLQRQLRDLLIDAQGRIWIAMMTRPPVVVWPDGHFTVWRSNAEGTDGLPSTFILTWCEAADGTVWAGTWSDGLFGMRLDANGAMRYDHITAASGLPSNTVYGLLRAHDNSIWGTSKSGLFRFEPSTHAMQHFNMNDGLPTPEIYMSLDLSPDGRRVFGGVYDGLITFDVDELRPEHRAPSVQVPMVQIPLVTVFDSAVAMNADLRGTTLIALPHDRSDLRFVLRSTNMVDPFNDTYAYRLGPDTNWTMAPSQDAIIFSQIPPGEHYFEVKARTGSGPWGPVSHVPFTILPPWWATWWFRLFMALLLATGAYIGFRAYLYVRLRRQRNAHERQQAVMHERMRIASDMHDDLGSGLSVIKVKSQIALLTEKDPQRVSELEEIARGSGELIDNMRQIVWTLGSGQESLADLVAYMRSYAGKYLEPHHIVCVFHADDPLPAITLTAIERRNLLLIGKEALHNVVKHANAKQVSITMALNDGLRLIINDNGRGLDPESPGTFGMGMRTMRQRAEQLGGTFKVENHDGTTLEFHFPGIGSTERSIVDA